MDKIDRALELQVIDWLQWAEFPDELGKPDYRELALELIAKRKSAYDAVVKERDQLKAEVARLRIENAECQDCSAQLTREQAAATAMKEALKGAHMFIRAVGAVARDLSVAGAAQEHCTEIDHALEKAEEVRRG